MIEEFKISDFLKVVLEDNGKSMIYLDNKPFSICKHLFIINPQNDKKVNEIESIDDLKQNYENSEHIKPKDLNITRKDLFWGHCSNLQMWFENDYDTRLIDSRLAFPILRRLVELGDKKALRVYKDEIVYRLENGNDSTTSFLLEHLKSFVNKKEFFDKEEREVLINILLEMKKKVKHTKKTMFFNKKLAIFNLLIQLGYEKAKEYIKESFDTALEMAKLQHDTERMKRNNEKRIIKELMRSFNVDDIFTYEEKLELIDKIDDIFYPLKF